MIDYEMVHFPPSMVACAALALTLKILNAGDWVSLTSHHVLAIRPPNQFELVLDPQLVLLTMECNLFAL